MPVDAIVVLLLVHSPPPAASVNSVVSPVQTYNLPLIEPGMELTVTTVVTTQPVVGIYEIVVVPAAIP